MFQWRSFKFFDQELVKEPESNDPLKLFQSFIPTCSSSGRGHLVFGDHQGVIRIVNRDYKVQQFSGFALDVVALHQLKRTNVLVSIGNDSVENTTVKIWKLDQTDQDGNPVLARKFTIFSSRFPKVPVSCFAVLEDLSQLAVGLGSGAVLLFDGNLMRDRHPSSRTLEKEGPCITNMFFRDVQGSDVSLFVTSTSAVRTYYTKRKSVIMIPLDSEGADLQCAVMNDEGRLIVARQEAVYFYEAEEKSICFGFEGMKKNVAWFNNYLILVCEDTKSAGRNTITIYDVKNKFIAFSNKIDFAVIDLVSEWGSIFVSTSQNRMFQLIEKDLPTKMRMLFKKNLYPIAISLAYSQDCDESYIKEIFQLYGDHLYMKQDFDGATQQYLETISYVEPSYVIRKFLDAQRIHNLTRYLQALHEKGCANTDHTTLLLNCYTKLKDTEKLDRFIRSDSIEFDVDTAINVLRQATFYDHATYLAKKYNNSDLYVQILLEDLDLSVEALDYIATLPFAKANAFMKMYGKRLVASNPSSVCELLKSLCTRYVAKGSDEPAEEKAMPDDYIHVFVDQPKYLREFLEHVVAKEPGSSAIMYNTLLELYLRHDEEESKEDVSRDDKIMTLLRSSQAKYDLDHALVLTKMYKFEKGVTFLYERLHLYHEILQYHMDRGQYQQVKNDCYKYGDSDPQLWIQALDFFAMKNGDECEQEIVEVLSTIEAKKLLPPLMVVQMLSKNPHKPLSVIKDYIIKTLQEEQAIITADQREIRRYQEETQAWREEIEELSTGARAFQNTQCDACTNQLQLPAVHFLCMHSFHERCLGDQDTECLKCSSDYRRVVEIQDKMKESASQHDQFFKLLDDSTDGFATVSEYFGRGIFHNEPPPEDDADKALP